MLDAIAGAPIVSILNSGASYLLIAVLVIACILAISVNENRLDEVREIERRIQRNSQEIGSISGKPESAGRIAELQSIAKGLDGTIGEINYRITYGSEQARQKPNKRLVDHFHGNSNATNLMIIGICACAIAFSVTRMRNREGLVIFDIGLGILTGLIATFFLRGGSAILSKTALSGVDSTNPYGVAFFAALVGLFMDYFYAYLGTIVPKG